MDDALRDVELTTPQWGVLMCLAESDGLTGAEMARMHHVTPQTMHTILHNLELAGLVRRERHPEHGTLLCVGVTEIGRERLRDAMCRVEEVHARMLRALDEHERETLLDLLGRCMHSIQADGAIPDDLSCAE